MGQREDLEAGIVLFVQGSGKKPYEIKRIGDTYSCTCTSWRLQSAAINRRTCKHLKAIRGFREEDNRINEDDLAKFASSLGGGLSKREQKAQGVEQVESTVVVPALSTGKPPCLLAEEWDWVSDPTDWWVSEKLNGLRGWWNGRDFISRLGNKFDVPDFFKEGLPTTKLDGELWTGRNQLPLINSIARSFGSGERWKEVKFLVFDAPDHGGKFEDRIHWLQQNVSGPYVQHVAQARCRSMEHLKSELKQIIAVRGEGLMLRKSGSLYEGYRSSTLLKVVEFHYAEAVVTGYTPGKGKNKGMMGALECKMPDTGKDFSVGTGFSDDERRNPPKIGATITYRYKEISHKGIPLNTSYAIEPIDR